MKNLHFLVSLIFLLFAYWQLNDDDWLLWFMAYGFVALIAGWHVYGGAPKVAIYAGLSVIMLWLATLLPDFIQWIRSGTPTITGQMQAESPHVELTREFLGLLICGLTLMFYARSRT